MSTETRAVLITGASRGIGRSIAVRLAELGWDIGIHFRGNLPAAEDVKEQVEKLGQKAVFCQADLQDTAAVEQALETFKANFGRIDALINNAGMAPRSRVDLLEISEESYDEVLAANLKGPFFLSQKVASWMLQLRKSAPERPLHIVNVSSISEYASTPERGQYCVAKAGIGMMTKLFAHRLAENEIQVNEIRPGIIATDMTAGVKEKYDRLIAEGLSPIRRWGRPEDVASAVATIVSGSFPFTTGTAFDVDGGFHIIRL